MTIVKSPHDPFFEMVNTGDGLTYPKDERRMIPSAEEWAAIRDRVDRFYAACDIRAIEEHNREQAAADAAAVELSRSFADPQPPPQHAPAGAVPGFVYLLHGLNTGWYKIGLSVNARRRTKQIGARSPFEIELVHKLAVDDMHRVEAHFHALFAAQRVNGEWFTLSPDDVAAFAAWEG